jgi:hypothetical protein
VPEEDIEIRIQTERAKADLRNLQDELERLRRENGEITLGFVKDSVASGLTSASGQVGASVAAFAQDPVGEGIKTAVEMIASQFPRLMSVLDTIGGQGIAGRVGPIAEQYARLTGQQLPEEVLMGLSNQAAGPERAAAEARRRVGVAARSAAGAESLGQGDNSAWDVLYEFDQAMKKFWASSPPTPRALGGG